MSVNQSQLFPATPLKTVHVEDRSSVIIDNDDDDFLVHDEVNSGFVSGFDDFINSGLFRIQGESHDYETIKKVFLTGIGTYADGTTILAIHKNLVSDSAMRARLLSFKIFGRAVGEKSCNDGNVRFAWYGGSREELCQIVSRGFNRYNEKTNNGNQSHGIGIHLSAGGYPSDCLGSSVADESGISHMLLCRVILGKMEEIPAGSKQYQPSSTEFDSGVDNLQKPRIYTVWNAFMNSHIFPICVISFRAASFNGTEKKQARKLKPSSPWMSFPSLLYILSKHLDPSKMTLIRKYYDGFVKNKISRLQLIQKVRQITGDRLLIQIIGRNNNKGV